MARGEQLEESRVLAPGLSEEAEVGARVFVRGEGSRLWDDEGRAYIDFTSGAFSNALGQKHPAVLAALHEQIDTLWNVHDFPTRVRLELCQALKTWLPPALCRFAFFTTGAEVVEAALRVVSVAVDPGRQYLATLRHGFHGKTTGARMLVHWDVGGLTSPSRSVLCHPAYCYRCPFELKYPSCNMLCATHTIRYACSKPNVGAFIYEPIQGAAGVIIPPVEYWERVATACRANGVLLVADEFLTAGGRTGAFLASTHFNVTPDLVLMGKGIASGFPFAAMVGTDAVLGSERLRNAGATSATYASHPFSLRAAEATLRALKGVAEKVAERGRAFVEGLRDVCKRAGFVGDVRGLGYLAALEFVIDEHSKTPDPQTARRVFTTCLERGLKVALGGHILRLAPPLNISEQDLETGLTTLADVLQDVCHE